MGSIPTNLMNAQRRRCEDSTYLYVVGFEGTRKAKLGISFGPEQRAAQLEGYLEWSQFAGFAAFDLEQNLHDRLPFQKWESYCGESYTVPAAVLARWCRRAIAPLPMPPEPDDLTWWAMTWHQRRDWSAPLICALGVADRFALVG